MGAHQMQWPKWPWLQLSKKEKSNDTPSLIANDGKNNSNPMAVANTFKNFFTSICWDCSVKNQIFKKRFLSTKNNDSFMITATNKEQIYKIKSSFNVNKSCGPNSNPSTILHLVQDQTSMHLATTWNFSFSTGIFPTILKTAKVYSIHEKGF